MSYRESGSPYAPHTAAETDAMLDAIGVDEVEDLFDVPESLRFEDSFDIAGRSEQATRRDVRSRLDRNEDLVEFLGRGHYDHYVPSVVDHVADRQEFLTSYTQYQPEIAQGFLQALFEYQSLLVELTGLSVANCSMYDAASALGEAATLAARVRDATGSTILVPELIRPGERAVLENYAAGADMTVETYPMVEANVDIAALEARLDEEVAMVYVQSPTVRGTIEARLGAVGDLLGEHDTLFCLGSDPVAMAVLEEPAAVGADVVVGDAATLGLGTAFGMGLGLFATREDYLRQVPGRLVGASEDASGRRAFTLTLQTREQHIRRERATSNICTNQAWVALRTAIHAAVLGPDGLVELATESVERARGVADRLDDLDGVAAPVDDRHHFREFVARTDTPAETVVADLRDHGFAVHAVEDHEIQVCVTETNADAVEDLVGAVGEVA
jgi:glycine dehydrogenase subunit 1